MYDTDVSLLPLTRIWHHRKPSLRKTLDMMEGIRELVGAVGEQA